MGTSGLLGGGLLRQPTIALGDKLETLAADARRTQYHLQDIPSAIDHALWELVEDYRKPVKPDTVVSHPPLSMHAVDLLLAYSERMATHTLREGTQAVLDNGMAALAIAFERADVREVLICLSLYVDAASRHSLSLGIWQQAGQFGDLVRRFLRRSDRDRSIEAMRYVIVQDSQQRPTYRPAW